MFTFSILQVDVVFFCMGTGKEKTSAQRFYLRVFFFWLWILHARNSFSAFSSVPFLFFLSPKCSPVLVSGIPALVVVLATALVVSPIVTTKVTLEI